MATSTRIRTASPAKKRKRTSPGKIIGTLTAVTLVGVAGVMGTFAALTDTTTNEDNEFNAATIDLADNDADGFMYQVDDQIPGEFVEKCIEISYTGGRDSDVELYMSTPVDLLAPYLNLTIEAGTQAGPAFPDCTGFAPDGAALFTGTLADFQTDHGAAGDGVAYSPNGSDPWASGDTAVYRVRLELADVVRGPGEDSSGSHNFTWQATAVA
jgi:predicted ribosomally synthesized peptide with SipW-like signal peptide